MPRRSQRPYLAASDLLHLSGLIGGAGLAAVLPHGADRVAGAALARLWKLLRRNEIAERAASIERILPDRFDAHEARGLAEAWMDRRAELYWGRKRGLWKSDWRIDLQLEGAEHVQGGLTAGRGVVIWFASFCDSSIFMRALAEAGVPLGHLSMAFHGVPSGTRFGKATIGRIHRRGEDRYLRERVVIPNRKDPSYVKKLRRLLAANHAVSIRADMMADSRNSAPCLGTRVRIAAGAPRIAFQAEAPLLPTFVRRIAPFRYRVEVEEPIPADAANRQDFITRAVAEFGRRLDRRLQEDAGDWDGWWGLDDLVVEQEV